MSTVGDLKAKAKHGLISVAPGSVLRRYRRERFWKVQEPEVQQLWEVVERRGTGGVCVDVGAHRGAFALAVERFFDLMVLLEPNPALIPEIVKVAGPHWRILNAGCSAGGGRAHLRTPVVDGAADPGRATFGDREELPGGTTVEAAIETPAVTIPLDALALADVRLLKIDVEGFELEVLAGASELLAACKPIVYIEVDEAESPAVAEVLEGAGLRREPLRSGNPWNQIWVPA